MLKKIFHRFNLLVLGVILLSTTPISTLNAQQLCGTLSVSVNGPHAGFSVRNASPGARLWVIVYNRSNENFAGHSPIQVDQDGSGNTSIPLTGDEYYAFLSENDHLSRNEARCSNTASFSVETIETKICGTDLYEERPTYCSVSAINRVRVPYSGCVGGAELCVADIISPVSPTTCSSAQGTGINTAIGCIPIGSANELIGFILRWGIGIGGGIAFLLMLYAGFIIMTSTGNPERLKGGQQLLTSAIAGLIMLIFSVFILRLIGINILQIPGFGT